MIKSRIKNTLAAFIAAVVVISTVPSVNAAASNIEYSASKSYKNGKYYSNLMKVKLTGDQVADIVNVAKSQVGYHESSSSSELSGNSSGSGNCTEYGRWYGDQGYWCNKFVSWCAYVAGVPTSIFPKLASATSSYQSFPSYGAKCFSFSGKKTLEPGDVIFCCTCGCGRGCIDHVGLVTDVDSDYIYSVEGNLSDKVRTVKYPASSGYCSSMRERINYVARPQYQDNSATLSDVDKATAIVFTKKSVYALYDYSLSLSDAKKFCKSVGGELAGKNKTVSKLIKKGDYDRYFIKVDGKSKILYTDGTCVSAPKKKRATGFVVRIPLSKVKPVNTASIGGKRYEIYDFPMTHDIAKAYVKSLGGKLAKVSKSSLTTVSVLFKESDAYRTYTKSKIALNNGSNSFASKKQLKKCSLIGFIAVYDEAEKATVSYNANGGKKTPNEQMCKIGTNIPLSKIVPEKSGKTFLGWSTEQKSKEAQYAPGSKISVKADTVLYAVFD